MALLQIFCIGRRRRREFLAQAARVDFDPDPLYGSDAERLAKKLFKYYDDKTPILKKYLS